MGRKIAIMGTGAVGGYAGAHMVQAGEDVTFIDPWPEHVEHMRKHGLRVTHAKDVAEFTVPVKVKSPAFSTVSLFIVTVSKWVRKLLTCTPVSWF